MILLRRRRALAAILAVLLLGIVLVAWLVPTSKRKSESINGLANTADSVEDNEQSFDDMPTSAPFTSILNPPPATYVSPEPPESIFANTTMSPTSSPSSSFYSSEPVQESPTYSPISRTTKTEGPATLSPVSTSTETVPPSIESRPVEADDFQPLQCNNALLSATCEPWSEVFPDNIGDEVVTIECGSCVEVDVPSLRLVGGLDIQGKLTVPDGFHWTLETTMIVVQGEWNVQSTGIITGSPVVNITLFGNENRTFLPVDRNEGLCGPTGCEVGPQSITVAGGRVNCECELHAGPRESLSLTHTTTHIS